MLDIKNQFNKISDNLDEFILQISTHIKNDKIYDQIIKLMSDLKTDTIKELFESFLKISKVFEILCFISNVEKSFKKAIHESQIYTIINPADISRELDRLTYMIYDLVRVQQLKDNEIFKITTELENEINDIKYFDKIFPESYNEFSDINTTLLYMSEDILEKKPDKCKLVEINIPNTVNNTFSIQPLINKKIVESDYVGLEKLSGLNEHIINRFNTSKVFDNTGINDIIVKGDIINIPPIYQKMTKDNKIYYRELADYPEKDLCKRYYTTALNLYTSNFENKRLAMLKRPDNKVKKSLDKDILGDISNNYNKNGRSLGNAIYDAMYKDSMTDEQILRLIGYSLEFESNKDDIRDDPHYFKKMSNFSILKNI